MSNRFLPESLQRVAELADAHPFYALVVTLLLCAVSWSVISAAPKPGDASRKSVEAEEDKTPPRNFTHEQLKAFRTEEDGGIYIAIRGEVFDVTEKAAIYGPGGSYEALTGRDASRALAKFALDGPDLDIVDISDLTYGEKEQLDGWYDKFKHMNDYPVRGRVVVPPKDLVFTEKKLAPFNGCQEVPEGYGAAPLYIAVRGRVYDVSFGGLTEMYLPGGPYARLAGRDGNRALGMMSLKEEDMFSRDISDFTPDHHKVLDDWAVKFGQRYPCVGVLTG